MKSISFKLTLIMLCVMLLGIATTVGVSLPISSSTITDESLSKIWSETGRQALIMDEWLVYQKATVSALAPALSQIHDYSKENLYNIFSAVLQANSVYQDVYMGFPDNTAVMGSGFPIENEYSWWRATERSWYQVAMEDTDRAGITSLYVDVATGDLCITVSHAVKRDGVVLGVVGIDILVNVLQDQVFASTLDATGFSMLLDSSGDILIHPDKDYAPNDKGEFNNLRTVKGGAYADLWKKISASDESNKYTDAKGTVQYYTSSTLDSTGWHMVTVLPAKVISQPITHLIFIVIPIAFVILLLTALIIYLIIRSLINRPLTNTTEMLHQVSESIDSAAIHLTAASTSLAEASSEQAASIEETSATMNETAAMVQQTVNNTFQAKELTDDAGKTMMEVLNREDELVKSMNDLNVSSIEISKVVSTISDIAFQTNILSLNASVEATRAGESGRSFMVVAEEVRSLAQRSSQSASDTDVMVRNNQSLTGQSMNNMNLVTRMLGEVGKKAQNTAVLLNDISVASEEQLRGIQQVNIALSDMEKATQASAAISEQSATAATNLQDQTDHLRQVYEDIYRLVNGGKR